MEQSLLLADTVPEATCTRGSTVTREEREQVVDAVLARYGHLGATLVADDQTLVKLLQNLQLLSTDTEVGEYLCSFLRA